MWGASVKSLNQKRHESLSILFLCHKPHSDIFSCYFINLTKKEKKKNHQKKAKMGKDILKQSQQSGLHCSSKHVKLD